MKAMFRTILAAIGALLWTAAATAQAPSGLSGRPLPQSLDASAEAKQSYDMCTNYRKYEDKTEEQRRAACRTATSFRDLTDSQSIAEKLCFNNISVQDGDFCHDVTLQLIGRDYFARLDSSNLKYVTDLLPAFCTAGHGRSCLLLGQWHILWRKSGSTLAMQDSQAIALLEKACSLKAPYACEAAVYQKFENTDFLDRMPGQAKPKKMSLADVADARCRTERHLSSCYYLARISKKDAPDSRERLRSACDAGSPMDCSFYASRVAYDGDLSTVDDILVKACTFSSFYCRELTRYRSGEFKYTRSRELLPPDPAYIRERLVELRKQRDTRKNNTNFIELMLCDGGDLSACRAAGIEVPRETPQFKRPDRETLIATLLPLADDKCRVKREAEFCREAALVLRPGFFGSEAADMPRAARFGAAACMLDKFDMCAFSGVALVEGQHGSPPDRKNGGALLNKGCSGRDAASCYFFAMVLAQAGQFDQAKVAAQTALEINPSLTEAKDLLAKLN